MEKATVPIHALCVFMPLDTKIRRSVRKSRLSQIHTITRSATVKAAGGHQFGPDGPSIFDTELIVLRKRMHEVRRQERNYSPPQHWMEWEKEWSVTYASDVCEAVGWLQNKVINTGPSVAIASLAFMSLSVPASVFLLLSQASAALSELSLMIHTKF
eukprot:PITA_24637